jgi:glutamine amidotransferase
MEHCHQVSSGFQAREFLSGTEGLSKVSMRIGIPNIACGNFASVLNIVARVGGSATILQKPEQVAECDKMILPGVGAFDHGMKSLHDGLWTDALHDFVLQRKRPILGICLGMQLMCRGSEEGVLPGLGWIDAHVRRFQLPAGSPLKVPHMGWNTITVRRQNTLLSPERGEQRFYFVHSFHAVCADAQDVIATAWHGSDVTAAFERQNVMGAQFHPEKSHRFGLALMKRFVEMPC